MFRGENNPAFLLENVTAVEIDVVRHDNFYFYNRRENGQSVITAERISPQRAAQIVESNADSDQYATGEVDFGLAVCEWTWTAKLAF